MFVMTAEMDLAAYAKPDAPGTRIEAERVGKNQMKVTPIVSAAKSKSPVKPSPDKDVQMIPVTDANKSPSAAGSRSRSGRGRNKNKGDKNETSSQVLPAEQRDLEERERRPVSQRQLWNPDNLKSNKNNSKVSSAKSPSKPPKSSSSSSSSVTSTSSSSQSIQKTVLKSSSKTPSESSTSKSSNSATPQSGSNTPTTSPDKANKARVKTENILLQRLDRLFKHHFSHMGQALGEEGNKRERKEQERLRNLVGKISETVNSTLPAQVSAQVNNVLLKELHNVLAPSLEAGLSKSLKASARQSISVVREQCMSEEFISSLANHLGQPVNHAFQACFRDILLPRFEKATVAIFAQIEKSFVERMDELKNEHGEMMELLVTQQEELNDTLLQNQGKNQKDSHNAQQVNLHNLLSQMQEEQRARDQRHEEQLTLLTNRLLEKDRMMNEIIHRNNTVIQNLHESLATRDHRLEKQMELLTTRLLNHQGSLNTVSTPETKIEPPLPTFESIIDLVKTGHVSEAFSQALKATGRNPQLLSELCKALDETLVCEDKSLSPALLLSLIQQHSFHLTDPQNALAWITEACMVLDESNPVVSPHLDSVLTEVLQNLDEKLPGLTRNDVLYNPLRMAKQAVRSKIRR